MNSIITIHGGNIQEEARRLGIKRDELLDASASLVPFAPPASLNLFLKQSISADSIKHYPDCTYKDLKEAIANLHKIEPSMVLPGNGASELLTWAGREASEKGLSCLPAPSFYDYTRALRCWNGQYKYMNLPLSWSANFPQHFPLIPNTDVVWITNPHNPTGQFWSFKSLESLLSSSSLVICDESFISLVPNGEEESLIQLTSNYPNLIVIRSLTKFFGMAGIRLGYAISNQKRLSKWEGMRDPWPVNSIASSIGTMLLKDKKNLEEWSQKVWLWIAKENPWLVAELSKLPGIKAHPSSTNFLLIEGEKSILGYRDSLVKQHILLRDCQSFRGLGEKWLRVSLQTRDDNRKIVNALKTTIEELG